MDCCEFHTEESCIKMFVFTTWCWDGVVFMHLGCGLFLNVIAVFSVFRKHTGVDEMALNHGGLKPFQICAQQRPAVVHKTASILIPSQGRYQCRSDVSRRMTHPHIYTRSEGSEGVGGRSP